MIGQRPIITSSEVEALRRDRSPARREVIAGKVAGMIDASLSERERALAAEILRRFVRDEIEQVRLAVAKAVAASPYLPADVARTLAEDVERVALPVLEFSPVLSEQDLVQLVKKSTPAKAEAIASRASVPAAVAEAVIETGHRSAIARLINNGGADLSETSLRIAVERHGDDDAVGRALVLRANLPQSVRAAIERAAQAHVGSYLRRYLNLPEQVIVDGLEQATAAKATTDQPAGAAGGNDKDATLPSLVPQGETPESYAKKLAYSGGISNETIMHALCTGERDFVETAIALRTGLAPDVVRERVFGADQELRRAVMNRAGIIEDDIPVMLAVLDIKDIDDPVVYQMAAITAANAASRNRSAAWARVARKITRSTDPGMHGLAVSAALLAALAVANPAAAQSPFYDRGRAYDRCASEAARSAGPAPRQHPRPGDDLVTLERAKQRHEDAYYQALDRCLSRVTDPRQPRRY